MREEREDKRQLGIIGVGGTGASGNTCALSLSTPMQQLALAIYTVKDKIYLPSKISTDITSRFRTETKAKIP